MSAGELNEILRAYYRDRADDERYRYILADFALDYDLKRKNAAVIIHGFIRYVLKQKDIEDEDEINRARALSDLYDCRLCVNAIEQVIARNIMKPAYIIKTGPQKDGPDTVIFATEELFEYSHCDWERFANCCSS